MHTSNSLLRSSRCFRCRTIVLVVLCYVWAVMLPVGVMPTLTADGSVTITLCPGAGLTVDSAQQHDQQEQAQQLFDQLFASSTQDAANDSAHNSAPDDDRGNDRSNDGSNALCQWSVMASSAATLPDNPMALLWLSLHGADYVEIPLPFALPKRLATQYSARGPPAFLLS